MPDDEEVEVDPDKADPDKLVDAFDDGEEDALDDEETDLDLTNEDGDDEEEEGGETLE